MSIYDDVRKPVKVLKPNEDTAAYKKGSKTEVSKGSPSRKSLFAGDRALNPMIECMKAEAKPRKVKTHKVDPFMVRQAKLLAAKNA